MASQSVFSACLQAALPKKAKLILNLTLTISFVTRDFHRFSHFLFLCVFREKPAACGAR
jgi:hypothetical protein